jgi:very-long-chain ceramide synthase
LALLFLAHVCIPKARIHTRTFFALSYYNPASGKYAAGLSDVNLIIFCIVLFTGLRAGIMEFILAPLGKWCGLRKRKELTRFSEQAWLLTYYSVFWTLGMVSTASF